MLKAEQEIAMQVNEGSAEFFRTRLMLEDGSSVYESREGRVLLRPVNLREPTEHRHRRLLGSGDTAFCPELNVLRPAWSFPHAMYKSRLVGFRYEPANEPLDHAAAHVGAVTLEGEIRVTLL